MINFFCFMRQNSYSPNICWMALFIFYLLFVKDIVEKEKEKKKAYSWLWTPRLSLASGAEVHRPRPLSHTPATFCVSTQTLNPAWWITLAKNLRNKVHITQRAAQEVLWGWDARPNKINVPATCITLSSASGSLIPKHPDCAFQEHSSSTQIKTVPVQRALNLPYLQGNH